MGWIEGSRALQPLVVAIARSVDEKSSIPELAFDRDTENPAQIKLSLKLLTGDARQLDRTLEASSARTSAPIPPGRRRARVDRLPGHAPLAEPRRRERALNPCREMNNKHLAVLIVVIATILCAQVVLQVRANLTKVQKAVAAERTAPSRSRRSSASNAPPSTSSSNPPPPCSPICSLGARAGRRRYARGRRTRHLRPRQAIRHHQPRPALRSRHHEEREHSPRRPREPHVRGRLRAHPQLARPDRARLPAARVSNLRITRGQTGNDIRMDLVLDLPLLKKETAPQ